MIDKTKYFYWLTGSEEEQEKEIVWREMYSAIGYIVHLMQMIDYNIANILAISDMNTKILEKEPLTEQEYVEIKDKAKKFYNKIISISTGRLRDKFKNSPLLSSDDVSLIQDAIKKRNEIIHKIFIDDLVAKKFDNLEEVDKYIDYLNKFEEDLRNLNEELLCIFRDNRFQLILFKTVLK